MQFLHGGCTQRQEIACTIRCSRVGSSITLVNMQQKEYNEKVVVHRDCRVFRDSRDSRDSCQSRNPGTEHSETFETFETFVFIYVAV